MDLVVQYAADPIVWLRLLKILGFAALAALLLLEYMTCGGSNRVFHRLLAILFLAEAFESYRMAESRAELMEHYPAYDMGKVLMSDVLVATALLAVLVHLIYQISRRRTYNGLHPKD